MLCSESMWPIGRINNASLIRDPPTKTPGGRGAGENPEQRVLRLWRANHHPQEHFYWKEFIYQRSLAIFSSVGGSVQRQAKIVLPTRGCLQRYAGDSFHHLFHISAATYFSFKRQLRPNWVTPNVAYRGKTIKETRAPPSVRQPTSKHAQTSRCSFVFGVPTRCESSSQNANDGIFSSTARPSGILCI